MELFRTVTIRKLSKLFCEIKTEYIEYLNRNNIIILLQNSVVDGIKRVWYIMIF